MSEATEKLYFCPGFIYNEYHGFYGGGSCGSPIKETDRGQMLRSGNDIVQKEQGPAYQLG